MLAVVGTIPDPSFPLVTGSVTIEGSTVSVDGHRAPVNRGTPALLAAAVRTGETLGQPPPFGYLIGDTGRGDGSRRLYEFLCEYLGRENHQTVVLHYMQPDVEWHRKFVRTIDGMAQRPVLIADAGFMYAAKMSGQSKAYDLFTPDIGEMAFLADEAAPHPFYTRGFILHEEDRVEDLITRAYTHENAARYLLVKGRQDYLANRDGIQAVINSHTEEAMEAIGGTGDTLTGIVAALISTGMQIIEAARVAARTNRLAGYYAKPTAATQVMELMSHIPRALEEVLRESDKEVAWEKASRG